MVGAVHRQSSLQTSFNRVEALESQVLGGFEEKSNYQIAEELERETKQRENSEWKKLEHQMVTEENEAKDKKKSVQKKIETPKNLNAPRSSKMKLSFAGEGEAP